MPRRIRNASTGTSTRKVQESISPLLSDTDKLETTGKEKVEVLDIFALVFSDNCSSQNSQMFGLAGED